ncbi:PepSY-associated TM helix domain-containing protein [Undibacterium sp.]|uniref:PepSY-associated TM helix domain-containing protein n=1 Tax=Undibacterium sp. TaxID=1914977 RepID=UPI0025FC632C|nr:PepSY-associated TM helix domain-containing protein [Undibacterium sp.]
MPTAPNVATKLAADAAPLCGFQAAAVGQKKRAFWMRQLHQWHWISSALCLMAMLMFALSGITLNHSAQIEAHPVLTHKEAQLPASLLKLLQARQAQVADAAGTPASATSATSAATAESAALPSAVANWLEATLAVSVAQRALEWSPQEVVVALPRPGGDAWLRIELDSGAIEYEKTERGWIAYLNDLHKGRNTGVAWSWFIDAFAVACLIFCLTGLLLLQVHAANRRATWPVVVLGLLLPALLAIVFIH